MATVGNTALTLTDWAKRLDPNGAIDQVVELLAEDNEIIEDALYLEGNLPTGHRTTVRTGLPAVAWRLLNYGVQPSKSTTAQVTDSAGMLEAFAEMDKDLAELNGNTAAFRLSEDVAFLEAMNQEFADTLFYGNTGIDPEKFLGLAPRYNDLSAANADAIIDAGGTGSDNTSIWLVLWGQKTCHMHFPKGSMAGISHKDLGLDVLEDAAGGKYMGYRTHFQMKAGLTVRDWRYVIRICNIDVSDLGTIANTKNILTWMVQASERIRNPGAGRAAFYVNRTIREKLRLGILEKIANNLSWENVAGKRVMMFDEIPVRRVDALLNTEARVT